MSRDLGAKRPFSRPSSDCNPNLSENSHSPIVLTNLKDTAELCSNESVVTPRVKRDQFSCPECGKIFTFKSNMKRHLVFKHRNSCDSKKCLNFKCETCGSQFSHEKNLNYHKRTIHMTQIKSEKLLICPICQNNFVKHNILTHFIDNHDIKIENTELKFPSFESFMTWKAEIESSTKSRFIRLGSKTPNLKKTTTYYFQCHRNGHFKSGSKGIRHIKKLGSKKINAYCPASIKVIESEGTDCSVIFQSTHVGHTNDLGHLILTNDEKNFLASKIAAKIPFDCILEEIRDSITDSGLERLHLLTRKDLHNIKKSYNLTSDSVKHTNGNVSVEMWIHEMQKSKTPTVLFETTDVILDDSNNQEIIDHEMCVTDTDTASDAIVKELSRGNTTHTQTLEERRQAIANNFNNLIMSITTSEQVDIMEKAYNSLVSRLNVVSNINIHKSFPEPSNQNSPLEM